jgi:hypothetical protein
MEEHGFCMDMDGPRDKNIDNLSMQVQEKQPGFAGYSVNTPRDLNDKWKIKEKLSE